LCVSCVLTTFNIDDDDDDDDDNDVCVCVLWLGFRKPLEVYNYS